MHVKELILYHINFVIKIVAILMVISIILICKNSIMEMYNSYKQIKLEHIEQKEKIKFNDKLNTWQENKTEVETEISDIDLKITMCNNKEDLSCYSENSKSDRLKGLNNKKSVLEDELEKLNENKPIYQ